MSNALFERYQKALRNGHVAAASGRLGDAMAAYREAIGLAGDRPLPYTALADVLFRLGDAERSLETSDEALELDPENEAGLLGRARALEALDRTDEAAETYDRLADARGIAGRLADACDAVRLAMAHRSTPARRHRLQDLTRTMRLAGGDPETERTLGRALGLANAGLDDAPAPLSPREAARLAAAEAAEMGAAEDAAAAMDAVAAEEVAAAESAAALTAALAAGTAPAAATGTGAGLAAPSAERVRDGRRVEPAAERVRDDRPVEPAAERAAPAPAEQPLPDEPLPATSPEAGAGSSADRWPANDISWWPAEDFAGAGGRDRAEIVGAPGPAWPDAEVGLYRDWDPLDETAVAGPLAPDGAGIISPDLQAARDTAEGGDEPEPVQAADEAAHDEAAHDEAAEPGEVARGADGAQRADVAADDEAERGEAAHGPEAHDDEAEPVEAAEQREAADKGPLDGGVDADDAEQLAGEAEGAAGIEPPADEAAHAAAAAHDEAAEPDEAAHAAAAAPDEAAEPGEAAHAADAGQFADDADQVAGPVAEHGVEADEAIQASAEIGEPADAIDGAAWQAGEPAAAQDGSGALTTGDLDAVHGTAADAAAGAPDQPADEAGPLADADEPGAGTGLAAGVEVAPDEAELAAAAVDEPADGPDLPATPADQPAAAAVPDAPPSAAAPAPPLAAAPPPPATATRTGAAAGPVVSTPRRPSRPPVPDVEPEALVIAAEESAARGDVGSAVVAAMLAARVFSARDAGNAALDVCTSALAIAPAHVDLHLLIAELYVARGWNQLAADTYQGLLRLARLDEDTVAHARVLEAAQAHLPGDARFGS